MRLTESWPKNWAIVYMIACLVHISLVCQTGTCSASCPKLEKLYMHIVHEIKPYSHCSSTKWLCAMSSTVMSGNTSCGIDLWHHDNYRVLDEHENPRNREPGCIYTIEYWMWLNTSEYANSESSSLFFYNPSRETVVYCQSRLHYCYKATVRRSNK
jgi:hypothetical protein